MAKDKQLIIAPCLVLKNPLHISFEADLSPLKNHFSKEKRDVFLKLYEQARAEPSEALGPLKQFALENPKAPVVLNLLAYVYLQLKNLEEADKLIEDTYHQFPEYLFGKINYADLLMRQKNWAQVPAVFNNDLDLTTLFPERQAFHNSEVRGFMTATGFYHHEIGQREKALECFRIAVQSEPEHPSVLALEKKLFHNATTRILRQLFRSLLRKR